MLRVEDGLQILGYVRHRGARENVKTRVPVDSSLTNHCFLILHSLLSLLCALLSEMIQNFIIYLYSFILLFHVVSP